MLKKTDILKGEIRRTALWLALVFTAIIILTVWSGLSIMRGYSQRIFESYIEEYPLLLLQSPITPEKFINLQEKLRGFQALHQETNATSAISLDVDELNHLIWSIPELRDRLRVVEITPYGINALVSIPFAYKSELRYVNGSAALKFLFDVGVINLSIKSLWIRGKPVPREYVEAMSRNLVRFIYPDHKTGLTGIKKVRDFLWNVRAIKLKQGTAVLVPL